MEQQAHRPAHRDETKVDHIEALRPHIADVPSKDQRNTADEPRVPHHVPVSPFRQGFSGRCEDVVTEDPSAQSNPRTIRGAHQRVVTVKLPGSPRLQPWGGMGVLYSPSVVCVR